MKRLAMDARSGSFTGLIVLSSSCIIVPKSLDGCLRKTELDEGRQVLRQLHGEQAAATESEAIEKSLNEESNIERASFLELLKPSLRFILGIGLLIGILQQATGINAIYFYDIHL